jgi:CelD/BcsL family acetyltransferase involved in cellulose biosynthesis
VTTIQKIESLEDKRIVDSWNTLNEASGCPHIHLTWEWISLWWKHFGGDRELMLLGAIEHDRVLAIAPLCIRKVGMGTACLRILEFLGTGLSDRGNFLWEPSRIDALRHILGYVYAQKKRWERISLRAFPEWSASNPAVKREAEILGLRISQPERGGSPYLKINGEWRTYFDNRGKNIRSDTRRRSNRLADFGNTCVKLLKSHDEILSTLDQVVQMGIQNPLKRHLFIHPAMKGFLAEMLTLFHRKGWLRFWVMESDGQLMSYIIGFLFKRTFYYWNLGYDPKFTACSPGRLLLIDVLKYCFEEKILEFDFMRGEETYKQHWATDIRYDIKLELFHSQWRSQAMNILCQGKPFVDRFFHFLAEKEPFS